jgi:hypothetical protein
MSKYVLYNPLTGIRTEYVDNDLIANDLKEISKQVLQIYGPTVTKLELDENGNITISNVDLNSFTGSGEPIIISNEIIED